LVQTEQFLKKKQWIVGLVVILALIVLVVWGRDRIHFNFADFRSELARVDWSRIAIGFACIYLGYVIRSVRWALLLRHNKRIPVLSLIGTQVMGFTAVALIGRVADLVRPYLVAKKTKLDISSQIAVYIVERLSDMGAMALIFSSAILLSPSGSMPHAELVKKTGYGFLAGTVAGALFLVAVRLNGQRIASLSERMIGAISKKLGHAVGQKIRTFHTGLDTIRSFSDFATLAALSVLMWCLIAAAYLETARAFVTDSPLANMTPANCVVLMLISGTASALQLPVIGWFTQIGIVEEAIRNIFGTSMEAATACATMILVVTFLAIIPVGLIWAQFEKVNLRTVSAESEHAGEQMAEEA
jgi:glycosyltransferase 2 family protein